MEFFYRKKVESEEEYAKVLHFLATACNLCVNLN
jgi:hypothetical protein